MKLATLTLHYGFNEGAMLQAWCLARSLKAALPGTSPEVHVLDHRYPAKQQLYGQADSPRKQAMMRFLREELSLSHRGFTSSSAGPTLRYLVDHYDGVVIGSDEVWRVDYQRRLFGLLTSQEGSWTPAFPNIYWPSAELSIPRASYAAAVDNLKDWSMAPAAHRAEMRRRIESFAYLGVRDQKTLAYLRWLDPPLAERANRTPDPCFSCDVISDVDPDALRDKLAAAGVDFSRPRLGLVLWHTVPAVDRLIKTLKQEKMQVIVLNGKHPDADVSLADLDLSPPEWGATFGCFSLCFSQRMHGCLFALLNNTPLIGIDPHLHPLGYPTKMYDLLDEARLLDFYFCPDTMHTDQLVARCRKAREGWPTDAVEIATNELRQRARDTIRELVHALGSPPATHHQPAATGAVEVS